MKMIKILGIVLSVAVMFMATQVHADYTLDLKNSEDTVIKTYTITTNQIAHIQKAADASNVSIIKYFEESLQSLVINSILLNKARWGRANDAYIEEQSRQP